MVLLLFWFSSVYHLSVFYNFFKGFYGSVNGLVSSECLCMRQGFIIFPFNNNVSLPIPGLFYDYSIFACHAIIVARVPINTTMD